MKRFTITMAATAGALALFMYAPNAYGLDDGIAEYSATSAAYADVMASAPDEFMELNVEDGVDSYAEANKDPSGAMLQRIRPAAGGGLTEHQLNNWELHRLQRFYNGDDGVTK